LRQLRALLDRHGFRPRRSLGQTFLVDGNIARKIVCLARISAADSVLEVGAGVGALTHALAEAAGRVVAVEVHPALVAMLRETLGAAAHPPHRVEIVEADVLQLPWPEVLGEERRGQWKAVANLPYSITGPAILRLLEAKEWLERLVIMVQREVAERLAAQAGERARGQLSVLVQAFCHVRVAAQVSRNCFWPRPKVDSTVLVLEVRRPALVRTEVEPVFRQLVQGAFSARRKMLANALGPVLRAESRSVPPRQVARLLLARSGIAPDLRAEDVSEEAFVRLAEAAADLGREAEI
jgi:16S rRNA (adenine1518-N6/adenine1519-N6)-dimethyltransferase